MMNLGVSPFSRNACLGCHGQGRDPFRLRRYRRDSPGPIVQNRVIERVLVERLERHANIHLYCPAELDRLAPAGDHAEIGSRTARCCVPAL